MKAIVSEAGKKETTTKTITQEFVKLEVSVNGPKVDIWPGDPTAFNATITGDRYLVQGNKVTKVKWHLQNLDGKETSTIESGPNANLSFARRGRYQVWAQIFPATGSKRDPIESNPLEVEVKGGFPTLVVKATPAQASGELAIGRLVRLSAELQEGDAQSVEGLKWQWRRTLDQTGVPVEPAKWNDIPPIAGAKQDKIEPRDWVIPNVAELVRGAEIQVRARIVPTPLLQKKINEKQRSEVASQPVTLSLASGVSDALYEDPARTEGVEAGQKQTYKCILVGSGPVAASKAQWECTWELGKQSGKPSCNRETEAQAVPETVNRLRFTNQVDLKDIPEGATVVVRVKFLDANGAPIRTSPEQAGHEWALEWRTPVTLPPITWRLTAHEPGRPEASMAFELGAEFDVKLEPAGDVDPTSVKWAPVDGLEQVGNAGISSRLKSRNFSGPRVVSVEFRRKGATTPERQQITVEVQRPKQSIQLDDLLVTLAPANQQARGTLKVKGSLRGVLNGKIVCTDASGNITTEPLKSESGQIDQDLSLPPGRYTIRLEGSSAQHRDLGGRKREAETVASNTKDIALSPPRVELAELACPPNSLDPDSDAIPTLLWQSSNDVTPAANQAHVNGFWCRSVRDSSEQDAESPSEDRSTIVKQLEAEGRLPAGHEGWAGVREILQRCGFEYCGPRDLNLKPLVEGFRQGGNWTNGHIDIIAIAIGNDV
ncbi:MAG: hypothetical protein ACOYLU_14175, partial [Limisphaerales bacterium]